MRRLSTIRLGGWIVALALMPSATFAGVRGSMVREAADTILRKIGKEASETSARKLDAFTARHGREAIEAARRIGPNAVTLIEEAGEHGGVAARLLARHGE